MTDEELLEMYEREWKKLMDEVNEVEYKIVNVKRRIAKRAAEQSVQSDLGGTSAQEVSPNEKDTGEGWGPLGNRPSR